MSARKSRPLFLFYLLVVYVFMQFTWWSYLMFKLNNEVYELKTELITESAIDNIDVISKTSELEKKLHLRWMMILGEGSVFLTLLILGIIQTRKAFRKENDLLNQQKNFLLSVTHELKSPIASMRLQLETILKRDLDVNRQREILTNAVSDSDRLNNLVENILLAARIEDSGYTVYKEKINLSEMLESLMRNFVSVKQKIESKIEKDIYLEADKMSIESIVSNLVDNAQKYSPVDSLISIGLKKINDSIIFSVSDQGPGIAADEQEKIFQKFYRTGNEETRNTKGTGLGLYIVKNLVKLHGGEIQLKPNQPKGSIFEVTLK